MKSLHREDQPLLGRHTELSFRWFDLSPGSSPLSVLSGAVVVGVSSAAKSAKSGKSGWIVAMLSYLVGSVISAIVVYLLDRQRFLSVNSPFFVVFTSPLLTPVFTNYR